VPDAVRQLPQQILLVSSDSPDRGLIATTLIAEGHRVPLAESAAAALAAVGQSRPDLLLVDLAGHHDALRLIRTVNSHKPPLPIVAIAAPRRGDLAATALATGVVDLVSRPIQRGDLLAAVESAIELRRLAGRPQPFEAPEQAGVFAGSSSMQALLQIVQRVAPTRCAVLIIGERGSGRDLVARVIHQASPWSDGPFVTMPLAGVTDDSFDPGVLDDRVAPASRGGSLYLKEVDQAPRSVRARLERALAARVGPREHRLLASASPTFDQAIERGASADGLFERLGVIRIDVPPLRERREDIPPLALQFLKEACRTHGFAPKALSRSALALLAALPWRGNTRELRLVVERLALLVEGSLVCQEDVLSQVSFETTSLRGPVQGTLREARERFEREYLTAVLEQYRGRVGLAARELGMERTNLYRKMNQLGMRSERRRVPADS
jgi:two-component system nitrogen regulation response regulator NtrX